MASFPSGHAEDDGKVTHTDSTVDSRNRSDRQSSCEPGPCPFKTLAEAVDAVQGLVPSRYFAGPKWDDICGHDSERIESFVLVSDGKKAELVSARVLLAKFLINVVCKMLTTELTTRQRFNEQGSIVDIVDDNEFDDIAPAIDRVVDFVMRELKIPVKFGENGSVLFLCP